MKEEITAGGREFVLAMVGAAFLYFVCWIVMSMFQSYAFLGGVISVAVFAVYGFFILTRYTARFTYSLNGGRLRVNRRIGKRNKEAEIDCSRIEGVYYGYKPMAFPKRYLSMRKSIINKRRSLYIEYRNDRDELCGIVIEPSDKLRGKIIKQKDKGKRHD